jgi:ubiquinone/menaquinone biosynthesis C-methylase UbiE
MNDNSRKKITPSTSWQEVASWYDQYVGQDGSDYHQHVILPGIARLLQIPQDKNEPFSLLDLACGQGVLQRYFDQPGIVHVGIDVAPDLIQLAKQRNTSQKVRYFTGSATKLLQEDGSLSFGLQPHSFDAVTIVLAIQNITPLSAVWQGVARLLKPNGKLVLVMMHPSFRIPRSATWQWNEQFHRQERTLWNYMTSHEIDISTHPGNNQKGTKTIHFHRPLQAYVNTLGNAKLYIDHLDEWVSHVPEQTGIKSDAILKAKKEFPMFMAIRAIKKD